VPQPVIVRFPPSPTGLLHIGTLRTCLFNYLFAKQHDGKIIMRLEDTDAARSTEAFAENILNGLQNLGLQWDGEIVRQSERTAIYRQHLQQMLTDGTAYYAFETPEQLEQIRAEQRANKLPPRIFGADRDGMLAAAEQRVTAGERAVVRFKLPRDEQDIVFNDTVRGDVKINTRELDDFVIAKSLDAPLYHLTVVVDDALMQVSHVIRGEDHISNTPKQILLFRALGFAVPQFAHLPLILNNDGSKLSKRKNSVSVDDYLAAGYLPAALLNYLALLGWSPTTDGDEIFTLTELLQQFALERVQKGGAKFDQKRLDFVNAQHIQKLTLDELHTAVQPFIANNKIIQQADNAQLCAALAILQTRLKTLAEAPELLELFFIADTDWRCDAGLFPHKKMKVDAAAARQVLQDFLPWLQAQSDWSTEGLQAAMIAEIAARGLKNGQVLWPLRVALSNAQFSPSPFEIAAVIGKERVLARVEMAIVALA